MSKAWYVLRVQSGKEDRVRTALERKIKIQGMEPLLGQILVPTKTETVMRGGEARVKETKIYPGYVYLEAEIYDGEEINDDFYYLIKETPFVGDFVGALGRPTAMAEDDVEKLLRREEAKVAIEKGEAPPVVEIPFAKGDKVKVNEGPFEGFDASVEEVHPEKGELTVILEIFGRPTKVDVSYWQVGEI